MKSRARASVHYVFLLFLSVCLLLRHLKEENELNNKMKGGGTQNGTERDLPDFKKI
jgi:hypothetical protein